MPFINGKIIIINRACAYEYKIYNFSKNYYVLTAPLQAVYRSKLELAQHSLHVAQMHMGQNKTVAHAQNTAYKATTKSRLARYIPLTTGPYPGRYRDKDLPSYIK